MREVEPIPGYLPRRIYLVRSDGVWYIQDDADEKISFLWGRKGGHMCLKTKGLRHEIIFHLHIL